MKFFNARWRIKVLTFDSSSGSGLSSSVADDDDGPPHSDLERFDFKDYLLFLFEEKSDQTFEIIKNIK